MDFSELYQRYAPDVYRFAFYLTGQSSDAEDITAETFARVWTSPEPLRAATVKAYLFTIARNLYRHARRIQARHVALDEEIMDPSLSPPAEASGASERIDARRAALDSRHLCGRVDGHARRLDRAGDDAGQSKRLSVRPQLRDRERSRIAVPILG